MNVKNSISVILSVICLTAGAANADTFKKFVYTDNGTTITIIRYPAVETGAVNIPAHIVGKPVTSIGDDAFGLCSSLTSINIPSSVITIGDSAFQGCSGLTSMTIPCGVTSIGGRAFEGCAQLKTIAVDVANPAYTSVDGVLFDKAEANLLKCPAGKEGTVTIPSSVTRIGVVAFRYCIGLTSMNIPLGVTSIGEQAFNSCTGLTRVTLSARVTNIALGTFANCTSLTSVTIPPSVTSIEESAFGGCTSLTSATFLGNAPTMGRNVFNDHAKGFTVYFTDGSQGFTSPLWNGQPAVALSAAPDIQVQQPVGTVLVDCTAKKSFGTVTIGVTSNAKTFTVSNTGLSDLMGLKISLNGINAADFKLTPIGMTSLPPSSKAVFKITFTPTAPGTRRAAIVVKSNDADENPFDIQLSGMGVAVNPRP